MANFYDALDRFGLHVSSEDYATGVFEPNSDKARRTLLEQCAFTHLEGGPAAVSKRLSGLSGESRGALAQLAGPLLEGMAATHPAGQRFQWLRRAILGLNDREHVAGTLETVMNSARTQSETDTGVFGELDNTVVINLEEERGRRARSLEESIGQPDEDPVRRVA